MRIARFTTGDDPRFALVQQEGDTTYLAVLGGDPLYMPAMPTGERIELGDGVPGRGGVGEEDRGSGAGEGLGGARIPLGVVLGAGEGDDDRQGAAGFVGGGARAADGVGEVPGGIGMGSVAEDEVEDEGQASEAADR